MNKQEQYLQDKFRDMQQNNKKSMVQQFLETDSDENSTPGNDHQRNDSDMMENLGSVINQKERPFIPILPAQNPDETIMEMTQQMSGGTGDMTVMQEGDEISFTRMNENNGIVIQQGTIIVNDSEFYNGTGSSTFMEMGDDVDRFERITGSGDSDNLMTGLGSMAHNP